MTLPLDQARHSFEAHFGAGGRLAFATAPGRVNLIGEHTDYHDGFVLPAAIERKVVTVGRSRGDRTVRLYSGTFREEHAFDLKAPMTGVRGWARRAEGIIRSVLPAGGEPRGLELWFDADLPVGGGLSSSAASMAALGLLAARLAGIELERKAFARTLQEAEHRFAGLKCGIMDQLAVLLGKEGHALLLDCRTLETRHVPLPEQWALVVLDTGVRHDLASSEYNRRQAECASVLRMIQERRPEVRALRDASREDIDELTGRADPTALRRCRHVLEENERVHAAVAAMAAGNGQRLKELFAASHASLRDDYQVSCAELDRMVEAAEASPGIVACRMTGGGFGGSTVNLVEAQRAEEFSRSALSRYREATGREGKAIVTPGAEGAVAGDL